ncbi:MAG TPA: site-2 protease family protein [Gemmatimonadaceae bacterium]
MTEVPVTSYFTHWRHLPLGDREIIEGAVPPAHAGPSPELAAAIARWPGSHYWEDSPAGRTLVLAAETHAPRERWWVHGVLLLLTLLSMTVAGATFAGIPATWHLPSLEAMRVGMWFSLPLCVILAAHESGHYLVSRRYRVNASPPYFLPYPPQFGLLGTMGAFIRLRSPVYDRRTLFDIGVAGPFAGIVVAIPILLIGLAHSATVALPGAPFAHQLIIVERWQLLLGDSLLLSLCRAIVGSQGTIALSPLAIAGWTGLFITCLNLLPLAQLDGGHITYALFGDKQQWMARFFWLLLIPLGVLWQGWWLWAVLALIIGRGRLGHPMIVAPERPLDARRQLLAWLSIVLLIVTFAPVAIVAPGL